MRKLLICFILIFCLSFLSSCRRQYEEGYFSYNILDKGENDKKISISGLTELGNEQKIIVIPKEINGKEVFELADRSKYYKRGEWSSNNLEKVFFTNNLPVYNNTFVNCKNLKKIIMIKFAPNDYVYGFHMASNGVEDISHYYVSKEMYDYRISINNGWPDYIKVANISYYYNYSTDENYGIYWIDDVDSENKIEYVPDDPVRDGYSFAGWYKEPDCINEWNFESDTIPTNPTDENGKVLFQEISIYAKWIEN